MKLFTTGPFVDEINEAKFFRFLQEFRQVPEFTDVRFEIADLHGYKREDGEKLLQRVYETRDSLLLGRKCKFEQFQE